LDFPLEAVVVAAVVAVGVGVGVVAVAAAAGLDAGALEVAGEVEVEELCE
jgi:hypothetical protein